jgi:hypothetical protein
LPARRDPSPAPPLDSSQNATGRPLVNQHPFAGDVHLQHHRRSQLDKLYQQVVDALDRLLRGVGLKAA